jgi:hypothetical protein
MTLHEVTPLEMFIETSLYYLGIALFFVVPALTALWAWSAFRRSKKIGYVWLAVFALTPYVTFTLNKVSHYIHREEIAKMNARRSDGTLVIERPITFPIYQLAFAAGVFLLYRAEKRSANQALAPTPASVTPAAGAPVAPDAGAAHLFNVRQKGFESSY